MAKAEATPVYVEKPTEVAAGAEEMVTVHLPKYHGESEDKVVWINDRRFLIKRGVDVSVPKSVALNLQEEERLLGISYDYIEANANS